MGLHKDPTSTSGCHSPLTHIPSDRGKTQNEHPNIIAVFFVFCFFSVLFPLKIHPLPCKKKREGESAVHSGGDRKPCRQWWNTL